MVDAFYHEPPIVPPSSTVAMGGVFTTLLVRESRPVYWEEHLDRLKRHARLAGLALPTGDPILDASRHWHDNITALMRIAIQDGTYHIQMRPHQQPPTGPVKVILSSEITNSRIKSSDRTVYDRALKQAQQAGAFEALLCNSEGYVVDGTRSSPFLIQGNRVISLLGGIEGITRQKALEAFAKQGFEIKEAYLKPHELKGELWIAGTGIGVLRAYLIKLEPRMNKMSVKTKSSLNF